MERRGKLIIIEGTDCSGKETQAKKITERLQKEGKKVFRFSFPQYDSPTGRIIGGPYLGKSYICDGWFPEETPNVDYLVASSYYAADRRYHMNTINEHLNKGEIVIIDRYVESNMAHQGGKLKDKEKRLKVYQKLDELEFGIMELPRPDAVIFLYMPLDYVEVLKKARSEKECLDQNEKCREHLQAAEDAYLELTEIYGFIKINCVKNDAIRTIDEISEDVYKNVMKVLEKK